MKRRVVLRRVAEREYDEAVNWYESQREGLGKEFRLVVEDQFERIALRPHSFPKVRGEVRRAVIVRRFPFVIHFVIENQGIVILSVFHTSRDPADLRNRR